MTAQADVSTIPDLASGPGDDSSYRASRDAEKARNPGFVPGPPLRKGLSESVPLDQLREDLFANHAPPSPNSFKDNRKIVTIVLSRNIVVQAGFAQLDHLAEDGSHIGEPSPTFTYSKLIRRLNLTGLGPFVWDSTLANLSRCEFLERLTLNGCKLLNRDALEATLKSWPNLIAIDLTNVSGTTNEAIISLTEISNKLKGVNLNGCRVPGDPALIALAKNCPELRRLKMGGSDLVTDVGISAVVKGCPLLLELDAHGCGNITDIAVREVWTRARRMRQLCLASCDRLTDLAFPSTVKIGEAGDAPRDQDEDNTSILGQREHNAARGQEAAEAEGCSVVTDPAEVVPEVQELAIVDPPTIGLCPLTVHQTSESLRILDLSSCTQITDNAIEGIISCAPKLRNIVLRKCALLTDRSVEAICKLGRALHNLDLAHVRQITDEAVKKLVQSCTRLRYVDFACCGNLTDESVVELSKLPKLHRIGLVRVCNITDTAIYALAARAASLERAHLSYCDQITLKAVHLLVDKALRLNHLSLTGIPAFLDPELQRFCREPPKGWAASQVAAFRVYSRHGINQLRNYLDSVFGEAFDEQRLSNTIGDAAPTVGDVGSGSDSDHSEFEADV
ncbi:hypothetical protein EST38_g9752 [Candolleomyces aberdarensis]|uniref:F-box/LRR-repeat protein 15-like leucin rich repeat domain-containing protein n=1 Tax=Candolleomyces aberdarensis TaxID=2316362 RepID=A0A4Q2D957_9AGAR|nr:hypothetical protein EST38_g9752 [Candolleomyces aberdarensis]